MSDAASRYNEMSYFLCILSFAAYLIRLGILGGLYSKVVQSLAVSTFLETNYDFSILG